MKLYLFLFFLLIGFSTAKGQTLHGEVDSLLNALPRAANDTIRARIYRNLYLTLQYEDPTKAITFAKKGLSIVEIMKWKKGLTIFNIDIGSFYSNTSNHALAIKHYLESLETIASLPSEEANIYNNLSIVYTKEEKFPIAANYAYKAIDLATKNNDSINMTSGLIHLGMIEKASQRFDKARNHFEKALKTNPLSQPIQKATILNQLADIETDIIKKRGFLLEAKTIWDIEAPTYLLAVSNLMSLAEVNLEVLNSAIPLKVSALSLSQAQLVKDTKTMLHRSIRISKSAKTQQNLMHAYGLLSQVYAIEKVYDSAYYYQNENLKLYESIFSQESKNEIAAMEADYNMQKKEDEFKQQQQIADLKLRQLYLYGILIFVLLTSILLYLLNRSRIKGLRLKNELQRKDVEEKTKELLHRNKLSESELKAIRAQMNPHFIFNVLNSIESYVLENDSKTASRLIQKFSTLSRLILENSTQSLVVAEREWKALQLYTELEAMRFNNRFQYSFISDPGLDLSKLMIPPMLVQPLIENSIHHGVFDASQSANQILVKIEDAFDNVIFTVEDNGPGIDETKQALNFSKVKTKSIGLAAIRERIEIISLLNGSATFVIRNKEVLEGRGTIAQLTLPKIYEFTAEQLSIPTSY